MSNGEGLSVHPLTQEESIYKPKRKGKGEESRKEKVTVAIVNIANHRLRETLRKLLQLETSMNTHLKAEENLEHVATSKRPMRHSFAQKEPSISKKKKSIRVSKSKFGKCKIQRQMSISERYSNWWKKLKISKCTTVRPKVDSVE